MSAAPAEPPSAQLGLVLPCRDEALVIGRLLASLARARWPRTEHAHRVVVVDDGSEDATAERARAMAPALAARGVALVVRANDVRPGKPGAIAAGLRSLEQEQHAPELVVLVDADVVLDEGALVALAGAFAREPRLALACGAQRFVRSLAPDGSPRSAEGGPLEEAGEGFDRLSALVRRAESRRGRLFSVHGQLLAWRASLALAPTPGLGADDLDLMLQVRARTEEPRRVALVREALFLERKTPPGPDARAQAERRARAWFCVLDAWDGRARRDLQWSFYRRVPGAAPELAVLAALALPSAAGLALGPWAALALVALELAFAASTGGRHALRLAGIIARTRRAAARSASTERWEMARR